MTFATAASLFTFTLEWFLHKEFHKRLNERGPSPKDADADIEMRGLEHPKEVDSDVERDRSLKRMRNLVRSYTFETGIIFHSIFIGITLGVSQNRSTVTALMIALFFHQVYPSRPASFHSQIS